MLGIWAEGKHIFVKFCSSGCPSIPPKGSLRRSVGPAQIRPACGSSLDRSHDTLSLAQTAPGAIESRAPPDDESGAADKQISTLWFGLLAALLRALFLPEIGVLPRDARARISLATPAFVGHGDMTRRNEAAGAVRRRTARAPILALLASLALTAWPQTKSEDLTSKSIEGQRFCLKIGAGLFSAIGETCDSCGLLPRSE